MADKSVSKAVKETLDRKPFIRSVMEIGALNYSGLARHLMPDLEEELRQEVSESAVIMAIKRYAKNHESSELSQKMQEALGKCDLRMEGNIVDFTIARTPENYQAVLDAYNEIDWEHGDIIYIYQSLTEIAVVLEKKNQHLILEKIDEDQFLRKEENLAMITIRTPKIIVGVPGVFHHLLGLIAREGISVVDILSTYTNLVLIVEEEEASRTYNTLFQAMKKA